MLQEETATPEDLVELRIISLEKLEAARRFVCNISVENVRSPSLITRCLARSSCTAHSEMQFLQVDHVTGNSFRRDRIV